MEIVLVRHSITQGNLEHRFIGITDVPIIPEGEALARKVQPAVPDVEHVYRSPLLRCQQTARLIWPTHTDHTVIEDLRETDFGPFEGKNHEELKDDPLYQKWITAPDPNLMPVGETPKACTVRAVRGLTSVIADARTHGYERVGILSHGGTIMALMCALGTPERDYYDWFCNNCGGFLTEVEEPLALRVLANVGNVQ